MSNRQGKGGRPRKPAALHLVDDTFRPDRHGSRDDARQAALASASERMPSPPAWLSRQGRSEWRRLGPRLHADGLLTSRHRTAFAAYCRAYAELVECQRDLDAKGRWVENAAGTLIAAPWVKTALSAAQQMRDFAVEFGLSPGAQARLGAPRKPQSDPLDEFLGDGAAGAKR